MAAIEETIRSVEQVRAHFTFTADADTLALAVNDDLAVVAVTRR